MNLKRQLKRSFPGQQTLLKRVFQSKSEEKLDDYELLDPNENNGEIEVSRKLFKVKKMEPDEKTKKLIEEFDESMKSGMDQIFSFNNIDLGFGLGFGSVELHIHD